MRIRSAAAVTLLALVVGAAPAYADYPPQFKTLDTTATATQNAGITVAANNFRFVRGTVLATRVVAPSATPRPVTLPALRTGQSIAPRVAGLPKRSDVVLKVVVDGKYIVLGTAKTDANGAIRFPGTKFRTPGTYYFFALLPDGTSVKLRVVVR
ncbi:MAG: hypothetical protein ACYC3W_06150 [Candidatus Nanopelagicales bacterium]